MTLLVLLVLAALWAVVLVPPVLRSRSQRSADSIGDFEHRLGVLRRTNGTRRAPGLSPRRTRGPEARPPLAVRGDGTVNRFGAPVPARGREAARRRQNVLAGLVVAAALTLVGAVVGGDPSLWVLHLLVDVALVAYVGLLVQYRRAASAAPRAAVHHLRPVEHAADESFVLRRVADL